MLQFRIFGYPVKVEWFFWLLCLVFGMGYINAGGPRGITLFVISSAIIFISVLVHELGHAWTRKRFGAPYSEIVLHGFGGYCTGPGQFTRAQSIGISAAGPATNIALAAIAFVVFTSVPNLPVLVKAALDQAIFLNLILAVFNLVPLYPLDGGQILAHMVGPRHFRTVLWIGVILAVLIAVYGLMNNLLFMTIILGMLAWENWQRLQHR